MASSKSFFFLLCALLAFVLIASAEASISYEESEKTEAVEGSGLPDGEYPADALGGDQGDGESLLKSKRGFCCKKCHKCKHGYYCKKCHKCCL